MKGLRVLGSLAVLLIVVGLGGVLASLVTNNTLFFGTGPAIVSLLVFVAAVFVFIAVGQPWDSWKRTPYW